MNDHLQTVDRSMARTTRRVAHVVDPATELETLVLVYNLLAATFNSPREALFDDLRAGRIEVTADRLAHLLGSRAPVLKPTDLPRLEATYVDLFVSSLKGIAAPPYLGYAIDNELLGEAAEALGRTLESQGVGISPTWRDLPDHIAAVSEAGLFLLGIERVDASRELLARFMLPWFDRYAHVVADRDVSGYYGPLITFLHGSIREVTRGNGS